MTTPVATTNIQGGIRWEDGAPWAAEHRSAVVQIVGVGSPHGDDQVGWRVADELASRIDDRGLTHVASRRARSPAQILDWLEGTKRLIVIDACSGLASPGQILHRRWPAIELDQLRCGSHNFSLLQTLAVAAQLQVLPPQIDVWCIEGTQFEADQPLSKSVLQTIPATADEIGRTLEAK
jgi:hydrogenase maturation protease